MVVDSLANNMSFNFYGQCCVWWYLLRLFGFGLFLYVDFSFCLVFCLGLKPPLQLNNNGTKFGFLLTKFSVLLHFFSLGLRIWIFIEIVKLKSWGLCTIFIGSNIIHVNAKNVSDCRGKLKTQKRPIFCYLVFEKKKMCQRIVGTEQGRRWVWWRNKISYSRTTLGLLCSSFPLLIHHRLRRNQIHLPRHMLMWWTMTAITG